ncbi:MAG: OmpA family protein [Polyangiales bacterium]
MFTVHMLRSWQWSMGGLAALALAFSAVACGPKYPNCKQDEDCKDSEYCVNGLCQMCRDDSDCAAGQACQSGRCENVPGYCSGAGDCPDGEECRNNRCVPQMSAAKQFDEQAPPAPACSLEAVYFSFDSDKLDNSSRDALSRNAKCIRDRNLDKVHLTGHADPRGTEEYNLALGDRRARSVLEYLNTLGVQDNALSASSVGEEMANGTDESSWSQDRKVEFTEQ